MGIPVTILLYAPDEAAAQKAAQAAYDRIKALDRIFSDYDPDSELMQLCTSAAPGEFRPVSPELFFILEKSLDLSRRSDGAFDISVGPLVRLWRIARRRHQLPDPELLTDARRRVGYQFIALDPGQQAVALNRPQMRLDLGAIAKGYAADEALRVLAAHGVSRALVEAGGDVAVSQPPPGRPHWRIEIEKNRGEAGEPLRLHLANAAVATSGDAYQFLVIDGIRYSHIIDPKTGVGITRAGSVTVVAPSGMDADGLASAVSVLGPQSGLKLIESIPSAEAYLVLSEEGPEQYSHYRSSGFAAYLAP